VSSLSDFFSQKKNLPNILTFSRIAVVPLLIILLYFDSRLLNLFTALLIIAAAVTDGLDGYLARKYQLVTSFGKLLDPVDDTPLADLNKHRAVIGTKDIGENGSTDEPGPQSSGD
jgi:phosphatidylglycerophosphate synthase